MDNEAAGTVECILDIDENPKIMNHEEAWASVESEHNAQIGKQMAQMWADYKDNSLVSEIFALQSGSHLVVSDSYRTLLSEKLRRAKRLSDRNSINYDNWVRRKSKSAANARRPITAIVSEPDSNITYTVKSLDMDAIESGSIGVQVKQYFDDNIVMALFENGTMLLAKDKSEINSMLGSSLETIALKATHEFEAGSSLALADNGRFYCMKGNKVQYEFDIDTLQPTFCQESLICIDSIKNLGAVDAAVKRNGNNKKRKQMIRTVKDVYLAMVDIALGDRKASDYIVTKRMEDGLKDVMRDNIDKMLGGYRTASALKRIEAVTQQYGASSALDKIIKDYIPVDEVAISFNGNCDKAGIIHSAAIKVGLSSKKHHSTERRSMNHTMPMKMIETGELPFRQLNPVNDIMIFTMFAAYVSSPIRKAISYLRR